MRKRVLVLVVIGGSILLTCASLIAQQATTAVSDDYIQLVRKDLRSDKKSLVAANMSLTESEATKFWPVYDQYTADLTKINDNKLAVIKEYAAKYENLSSEEAQALVRKWNEADDAVIQLRLKYLPKFQDALHNKKTARFFQLDRRIGLVMDLQLASEIPLVEQ
jgi:Spy/CpxP family protein refolding chaperone